MNRRPYAAPSEQILLSRETAAVREKALRIDSVNLRFFTGFVISPPSMRNVPSRVMPVMTAFMGSTTFV